MIKHNFQLRFAKRIELGLRLRKTTCLALALFTPSIGFVGASEVAAQVGARPVAARARPAHRPVHRPVHRPRRAVIVAPVRPIPAVRPWYWGRVVAGVTIGTIIVVAVVASAPKPPSSELCWYWTDSKKNRGYWDYCIAPRA